MCKVTFPLFYNSTGKEQKKIKTKNKNKYLVVQKKFASVDNNIGKETT